MAAPARLRAVVLVAAVAVSLVGAVVWSRTIAGDGGGDVEAVLRDPGAYVDPGAPTNPPLPTDRLPAVDLLAADGTTVPLATDGRPMVVNLWYSTCPPCARELLEFAAVHAEVGDAVRFVGVDPYDSADAMAEFAGERGVTYELLRDPGSALADALAVVGYPVTVFVAADGTILERTGALDGGELRDRLAAHWGVG